MLADVDALGSDEGSVVQQGLTAARLDAMAVGFLATAEGDRVGAGVADEHGHAAAIRGLVPEQAVEVGP